MKQIFLIFTIFAFGMCAPSEKPCDAPCSGTEFIDTGDTLYPSKRFLWFSKELKKIGYCPPNMVYRYRKEPFKRLSTSLERYNYSYVKKDVWSISLCPCSDIKSGKEVAKITEYQLAGADTIKWEHLTNFFGTMFQGKEINMWENVYIFHPIDSVNMVHRDSIYDYFDFRQSPKALHWRDNPRFKGKM
jgi:hypothetical protein